MLAAQNTRSFSRLYSLFVSVRAGSLTFTDIKESPGSPKIDLW
jgi:hypothetical protein